MGKNRPRHVFFPGCFRLSAKHKGGGEKTLNTKDQSNVAMHEGRPGIRSEETKHVAACRNEKISLASVPNRVKKRDSTGPVGRLSADLQHTSNIHKPDTRLSRACSCDLKTITDRLGMNFRTGDIGDPILESVTGVGSPLSYRAWDGDHRVTTIQKGERIIRMPYKQISRILAEIIGPETPIKIVLATSNFLVKNEVLPKLGPYKKRSAAQLLWCVASDSTRSPEERWDAQEKLLRPSVAKQRTKSSSEQRPKQNPARSSEPRPDGNRSSSRPDKAQPTRNGLVVDTEAKETTLLSTGLEGTYVK